MKHNSLISANGLLHNPLASTTIKSSFLTAIFKPLLMLFLLVMGSSVVWGDGYYAVHGNNWQGTDGGQWNDNNNKARMSHQADGVYWCDKVAVSNGTTILFKILYGSGYDGSGFDWGNQKDATLIDNSRGNATLVDDSDPNDHRIQYTATENVDLYIYTNGSAIWANAVPQGTATLDATAYFIQSDLWCGTDGGWNKYLCAPQLTKAPAGELAYVTFYMPAASNSNTTKVRFETFSWDGSSKADGKYTNYTQINRSNTSEYRFVNCTDASSSISKCMASISGTGTNHTGAKLVRVEYNKSRTIVAVSDAPAMTGNWYVYINKELKGQLTDGSLVVENCPANNSGGFNSIYIANRNDWGNKNGDIKKESSQGIAWFGGLYIDEEGSSGITWNNGIYYDSGKFSSQNFSLITITDGKGNDARGGFKLASTSNLRVTLTNGVITLSTAAAPEPPTPSSVTYDGSEIFYFHKNSSGFDWNIWNNDCALYLQFSNADESSTARSTKVGYFWDTDNTSGDVLATRVPAGTWTKVRVIRTRNEERNTVWNEGSYATLEEGKNYINNSNTMAVYSPRTFHFYISGSSTLAETGSDFNAWNGNGTAHSGSMTKTLNAGTYKFKLNPTGTVDWRSEFNWNDIDLPNSSNNINLRKGTDNGEIWFDLANRSQVTIACDGSKVTVVATPVQQYTVTFNTDGGSTIDPVQVSDGSPVAQPADPTKAGHIFSKWQLNGSDYNFSNHVTGNITLDAVWAYKAISSVVLNESTHMTWVGNTDFTLTPTLTPSDAIAKNVAWSSDVESVATVSGGTVHAVSAGSAIITCTVTDQFDTQLSASCEVTVAACQMIVNNLYSMTVTGYNSKTGDNADLSGLWNESSDNDGPASMTRCNIRVGNNNGSGEWYAYDNNGQVFADNDATHYWYLYASNSTVGSNPVYYVQDVSTGKYMYMTTTFPAGQSTVNNPDWVTYPIMTGDKVNNNDNYLWYAGTGSGSKGVIVCYNGSKKANVSAETDGKNSCIISRRHWTETWMWNNAPTHAVGASHGAHQGGGNYTDMQSAFVNVENIPNPNYKASLMNGSYYRMNTDATVQANLNAALVSGAVITVRLYADAATSVKLQKTDGTEIETIDLSADAELEYSYTVASNSALLGENAFVIKAADNHAGIASIVVTRTYAAIPSDPVLEWETDLSGGVTRSVLSGTFQHIASSTLSSGAIHYISSDETVATVAADGTVTPLVAGNTTITATIEAEGCYAEAYITYNVTLTEASLQEAIDATPGGGTLALTHDYNDNAKINKAITINGGNHTIGDLKIENTGDLTLSSGLIVRDFTICAKAGNTSIQAASGQVRNATNLTVNGNAYFLYTVDPSGHVQYGWYDFTVPFPVNVMSGIAGIQDNDLNEDFVNERDYAIMEYLGERKAQGQYPYQKFRGVMQPKQLYSISLDNRDNYNTVRFRKTADGELVADDNVTLHAYAGSGAYNNLNGVGNGTLHHADAGNLSVDFVQVYQSGDKTFLPVDKNQYSFVVGTAFMVQETGTMTLSQANPEHNLLAPARQASAPATAIQIAREGQPFSDQLFISASETGGQAYTPGTDLAKAGTLGSANVPQIWTTAYNNPLCVHEAQLINGEASYNLSLYAPAADTYTLTSLNIPADYSLYLTQNGTMLTELSGTYTLDLNKGITTEYGLLLVETYKTPTGIEEHMSQESRVKSQKILHNGVLYILHNGKIYNAQGGKVCDL